MTAGSPLASNTLAPSETATEKKRWPERSIASGNGAWTLAATSRAALPHSSQVALAPGIAMPACSNSVLLTKGPDTVSCVMKPVIALLSPSGRIQGRNGPKFFSQ